MKLHLTLEKDGVTKVESLDLSKVRSLGDYAKTIRGYIDAKWKLKDVQCKNRKVEDFFRNMIKQYEANPEEFSVPVLDTVKLGLEISKGKKLRHKWEEESRRKG